MSNGPTPKRISNPNSVSTTPRSISPKRISSTGVSRSTSPKRSSNLGSKPITPTHRVSTPPSGIVTPTRNDSDKQEKFKALIQGYTIVDREMLDKLQHDDFIRYTKTNGQCVLGGYIVEIRMINDTRVESFVLSPQPKKFRGDIYEAKVADISRIYKKPPSVYHIEHILRNRQLVSMRAEIDALKNVKNDNEKMRALEAQVTMLNNKLNDLLAKLKK